MKPVVAIIAPGSMGAALGRTLVHAGLRVITSLAGRSVATRERAVAAGLQPVADEELMHAQLLLSIVPPAAALPLAEQLAPRLRAATHRPLYVDCNAVSPATVQSIAACISAAGAAFVDGGIIGAPPHPGAGGPHIYVSGPDAERVRVLADFGLTIRALPAPIGAASALKMSYAGITKGLTAVASAMLLAAQRAGVGEALHAELAESQRTLLASLERSIPGMFPKAHRWVAEMREIAAFAAPDSAAAAIYTGAAALYERLARDVEGERIETAALNRSLAPRALR